MAHKVWMVVFVAAMALTVALSCKEEAREGSSESWTEWAKDKISEGLRFENKASDEAHQYSEKAGDAAEVAKGKAYEAGEKAAKVAKETAQAAKDKAYETAHKAYETAQAATHSAKHDQVFLDDEL